MRTLALSVAAAMVLSVGGCGPYISEVRMAYAPPRPENCDIKIVNVPAASLGPTNPEYEVLGMVVLQSTRHEDPFAEEILAELRPRFCKLGGEEVSLGMNTNVDGGGSATNYNVLKRKGAPAAPAAAPPADGAQP